MSPVFAVGGGIVKEIRKLSHEDVQNVPKLPKETVVLSCKKRPFLAASVIETFLIMMAPSPVSRFRENST